MNLSEAQLLEFLKHKKEGGINTFISLKAQGDETLISKEPINLCIVTIDKNKYFFGGISESFYDGLVELYDYREEI
jgi:hypothetical protein